MRAATVPGKHMCVQDLVNRRGHGMRLDMRSGQHDEMAHATHMVVLDRLTCRQMVEGEPDT